MEFLPRSWVQWGVDYYHTPQWRRLRTQVKARDCWQCQICGDVEGAPFCILHAHHIVPRSKGGTDSPDNLITICDLCHAVVTIRWHKPWFPGTTAAQLKGMAEDYNWFLTLSPEKMTAVRSMVWAHFGVVRKVASA